MVVGRFNFRSIRLFIAGLPGLATLGHRSISLYNHGAYSRSRLILSNLVLTKVLIATKSILQTLFFLSLKSDVMALIFTFSTLNHFAPHFLVLIVTCVLTALCFGSLSPCFHIWIFSLERCQRCEAYKIITYHITVFDIHRSPCPPTGCLGDLKTGYNSEYFRLKQYPCLVF